MDFRLCFFGHACTFCYFSSSFFYCLSLLSCILFILSSSFSFRFFSRSSRLMRFSLSSLSLWRLPFSCTFAVIFRMSLHKDIFLPTSSFCVLVRHCRCEDKMDPSITLDWCFGLELAAATVLVILVFSIATSSIVLLLCSCHLSATLYFLFHFVYSSIAIVSCHFFRCSAVSCYSVSSSPVSLGPCLTCSSSSSRPLAVVLSSCSLSHFGV